MLRENAEVEAVTVRLQEISSKLEGSIPADSAGLNSDQLRLQRICEECSQVSKELLLYLEKLKVSEGTEHRGWESFRKALKAVWSIDKVDAMAKRLEGLRAELDSHVLMLLE